MNFRELRVALALTCMYYYRNSLFWTRRDPLMRSHYLMADDFSLGDCADIAPLAVALATSSD